MADATPLLSQPKFPGDKARSCPSLDDAIELYVGATGISQFLQALVVALAWAFDAQQTFICVFTDASPTWHFVDDKSCSASVTSPCGLPSGSWAWDNPSKASIISEWELQCAGPAIVGSPASAFFIGSLVGGFLLSTLADTWVGRRTMLSLSCLTMSLASLLTIASPGIWFYVAARFICGFARATVGTCALVLSTELVGKKTRDKISVAGFISFTLGFLSLPGMAYINRDSSWRTLYLWTSIPSFIYSIIVFFFIPESPRWLLVKGRREEAIQTLKAIATSNGISAVTSSFSALAVVEDSSDASNWNVFSALKVLWERKWAFRRLLTVMAVGFGVGTVYYGMPLGVGSLGFNLYISVTMNAIAELPASMITFLLVGRINRRTAIVGFTLVSGVCNALCIVLTPEGIKIAAEVVAFFSACTAFNVLLIYSIELFPSCVRNSAISMVRQAVVLGGFWAPVLVAAGRKKGFLSFGVFGIVISCFGLFAVGLPETRGAGICDTMEEEGRRYQEQKGSRMILP